MFIRNKKHLPHNKTGLIIFSFLFPGLAILTAVLFFPTVYAFILSFFKWILGREREFAGISNYIKIFTMPDILHSIWITILFAVVTTGLTIICSLYLAMLLNLEIKGSKMLLAILLIPWSIPPVINGIMWNWIFNPRMGILNNVLLKIGLIDNFVIWQQRNWLAFTIIIVASVYKLIPFTTFILAAGLKTIPKVIYEAGLIDGASAVGKFFKITLPLLSPKVAVATILLSIGTIGAFDVIYVITGGGPANFTNVLNMKAYMVTFKFLNFGLGSAISFFITTLTLIIALIYYRLIYKEIRFD